VAGCCQHGDEPSGPRSTDLVTILRENRRNNVHITMLFSVKKPNSNY
jgi:hypothetical protein